MNDIEAEVQRRTVLMQSQHNQEIAEKDQAIASLTDHLMNLSKSLERLEDSPYIFGVVCNVDNTPESYRFKTQDAVVVCDQTNDFHGLSGVIISHDPVVDENGLITVELTNKVVEKYSIGLKSPAQIYLAQKSDGTRTLISVDGKILEVRGVPELELVPGDVVKITIATQQIVAVGNPEIISGPIVLITSINEDGIEVDNGGDRRLVLNPLDLEVKEGDRIVIDSSYAIILRKLKKDPRSRYKLLNPINVSWDDIGGLENAKLECRESIELPYQNPELFEFYNMKPDRGILLYGPPGCGKTMMAKAIATSIAKIHNHNITDSGYIYVKAPEILDKWVGNTEAEVRTIFERSREHYRQHNFKAVLAIDEADAILPQRGTRRSSDVSDTIVPMFLGEMDGVDDQQTKENPIVILMTNRSDVLDPAVTRPGRISKHIKISRPDQETTVKILNLHSNNAPFADENKEVIFAITCQNIFSKSRLLYRVNNEHDFTFGDCISGAMIEAICEKAKMIALHRDLEQKTKSGLVLKDFLDAVQSIYLNQKGLNHSYDLEDFAEKIGIQSSQMKITRCFGAA